jgi:hypothetical protein
MSRTNPRYHRVNAPGNPITNTLGAVRYKILGVIEGQLTVSDFDYVGPVNLPTQAQLTTLLTNIKNAMNSAYRNCISADWVCSYETLDVIHVNTIVGVKDTTNAGFVGLRPAGHEPTEVAQPIIKVGFIKGQHGRGRVSLPAIATGDVTGSKLTNATVLTNIGTFITTMLTSYSDGSNTWQPAVTTRSSALPKVAVAYSLLTRAYMSTYLGTVRRRKIGRGK